jgi:hypothetical protein
MTPGLAFNFFFLLCICSPQMQSITGLNPGQAKQKTIKLVLIVSPLNIQR